jgi:hypothetical protein
MGSIDCSGHHKYIFRTAFPYFFIVILIHFFEFVRTNGENWSGSLMEFTVPLFLIVHNCVTLHAHRVLRRNTFPAACCGSGCIPN